MPPGLRTPYDPKDEEEGEDEAPAEEEEEDDRPYPAPTIDGDGPDGPQTPAPETPSPDGGAAPQTPTQPPQRPDARPAGARTRPATGAATSWHLWWDCNRADVLGLRALVRNEGVVTGVRAPAPRDPLGAARADVRAALRAAALARTLAPELRTQALYALGRAGAAEDADAILGVLRDPREARDVREAAAVALALLPPIEAPALRERVRHDLEWCINDREAPQRLREYGLIAAGFRARDDEAIGLKLAARCKGSLKTWDEGAAIALALGLSEDTLLLPELLDAALNGQICGIELHDVGRSHAILALGRTRSAAAIPALARILQSRKTGIESRRSAVLATGRLLQEDCVDAEGAKPAARELARLLESGRDPLVRGFCAVALGAAKPPLELKLLEEAVGRQGDAVLRTHAALGLGLAARTLGEADGKAIRTLLADELSATREMEQASALVVGLGLARAREVLPELIARLEDKGSAEAMRTAAAEALGLVGVTSAPVLQALREALLEPEVHLVRAAAESLAMLGDAGSAVQVLQLLEKTTSAHLHSHLAGAVGLAGNPAATGHLLKLLCNEGADTSARADAAMALGLLGDLRERDGLYAFNAWFNLQATTPVTREILVAGCGCRMGTLSR